MTLQKLPHELIKELLDAMDFTITYKTITDNLDGTYVLNDVCDFHYVQIGREVTIDGDTFRVIAYDYTAKTLTVESVDGSVLVEYLTDGDGNYILDDNDNRIIVGTPALSFELYRPLFVHGTPVKEDGELKQIDRIDAKTPLVYLMEPYKTVEDRDYDSAIAYRSDITLCFLTECDTSTWSTDDHYHRAIDPMRILMGEVMDAIDASKLFYTEYQRSAPTYYANFGINIREYGQKKLLFSENLSGCSDDIRLEVCKVDTCDC